MTIAPMKAMRYPLRLLVVIAIRLLPLAAKQLSNKKVVETGILKRVRMRRKRYIAYN